ncbi:hypothetical protein BCR33DRAFT_785374 [Rhizoclosmatium globosum]|uniref:Uncharacterized protein n=1 Tax=Rhizoclosmatium globosum TaxID=329046 RepID=A0A1Y2CCU8_9FUNG|nr:hypothetical protein BCR33DRAFT_785374 [Rhizoclosmatium globosum]|eukprot:ORY44145.1 hypothetical protein BCR33DRAFT_785374 [Rhizoclosmatium globosum]
MAALIQNLIKDVTTLRAETLIQTEKILSQLAHLSAQQPPLLTTQCPTPVQPELQSTFPAPPPTSTPPPTASKETLHKHLGIHWSEATYPDSKPTPIFSNTVKLAASSRRASLASGSLVSNASLSEVSSGSLVGQYARFRDSTFGRGGVGGGRKGVRNSVIAVGSLRNSVVGIGGVGKLRGTRNTAARPVSWLQYTTAAHEAVVGASRLGVEVSNGNEEGDVEEGCMTEVARDVHETPVESLEKFEVLVSKSVSGTVEDLAETTKNDSGTPPARATISTASVKEEALRGGSCCS